MKEWSWLEKGRKARTGGKRRGLGERAKGGQVVWCDREGGHAGAGREGMGIREQTERKKRKRNAKRDWDISNV